MTAHDELLGVLREFHRDRLSQRQRHVAVARAVGKYEFNNAYQYIICREDVHLQWLEAAIVELGGPIDDVPEPVLQTPSGKDVATPLIQQDARDNGELVSRWRPRAALVKNARHRSMFGVILGEALEHKRLFEQMAAGDDDVLGRRSNGPGSPGTAGTVMAERWVGWKG